jgi:hypothetical protein
MFIILGQSKKINNIKKQQQYKQINQLEINFIMIFVIISSSKPYWSF